MNKPGKYVAFEDLGGFENVVEERVLKLQVCGKDLGNFLFDGMNIISEYKDF